MPLFPAFFDCCTGGLDWGGLYGAGLLVTSASIRHAFRAVKYATVPSSFFHSRPVTLNLTVIF